MRRLLALNFPRILLFPSSRLINKSLRSYVMILCSEYFARKCCIFEFHKIDLHKPDHEAAVCSKMEMAIYQTTLSHSKRTIIVLFTAPVI
jgi:hypothetical protein